MASPTRLVNSPSTDDLSQPLAEEFRRLFAAATEEVFEHGMDSGFSLRLASLIELYQGLAIRIISDSLASGSLDKAVAMETLRQLGLSEHEPTYDARKDLLLQHLSSEMAMIRYGAMYGLTSMDDPETLPDIERAFQQESNPDLLQYMSAALEQLRDTQTGA